MDSLETKVANPAADYDDVLSAFEAFKEANDDRLAQIEKRQSADHVLGNHGSLDDLRVGISRLVREIEGSTSPPRSERTSTWTLAFPCNKSLPLLVPESCG